jgi:hypothetical protein
LFHGYEESKKIVAFWDQWHQVIAYLLIEMALLFEKMLHDIGSVRGITIGMSNRTNDAACLAYLVLIIVKVMELWISRKLVINYMQNLSLMILRRIEVEDGSSRRSSAHIALLNITNAASISLGESGKVRKSLHDPSSTSSVAPSPNAEAEVALSDIEVGVTQSQQQQQQGHSMTNTSVNSPTTVQSKSSGETKIAAASLSPFYDELKVILDSSYFYDAMVARVIWSCLIGVAIVKYGL